MASRGKTSLPGKYFHHNFRPGLRTANRKQKKPPPISGEIGGGRVGGAAT
jgi:hypothetical protein